MTRSNCCTIDLQDNVLSLPYMVVRQKLSCRPVEVQVFCGYLEAAESPKICSPSVSSGNLPLAFLDSF